MRTFYLRCALTVAAAFTLYTLTHSGTGQYYTEEAIGSTQLVDELDAGSSIYDAEHVKTKIDHVNRDQFEKDGSNSRIHESSSSYGGLPQPLGAAHWMRWVTDNLTNQVVGSIVNTSSSKIRSSNGTLTVQSLENRDSGKDAIEEGRLRAHIPTSVFTRIAKDANDQPSDSHPSAHQGTVDKMPARTSPSQYTGAWYPEAGYGDVKHSGGPPFLTASTGIDNRSTLPFLRCFGQAAAYAGSWVARRSTFLRTPFPNHTAMEYHDFNLFTAGGGTVRYVPFVQYYYHIAYLPITCTAFK